MPSEVITPGARLAKPVRPSVNHRVLIDVLRHVAGLAVRVAHFGVLQKKSAHVAERESPRKSQWFHDFFSLFLLAFGDDGSPRGAVLAATRESGMVQRASAVAATSTSPHR